MFLGELWTELGGELGELWGGTSFWGEVGGDANELEPGGTISEAAEVVPVDAAASAEVVPVDGAACDADIG